MTTVTSAQYDVFLDQLSDRFQAGKQIIISRAPGRLDVMGGFGDYSGCNVLEWPLHNACFCALQESDDDIISIHSVQAGVQTIEVTWQAPLSAVNAAMLASPIVFHQDKADDWVAYVLGALPILKKAYGADLKSGLRIYLRSDVPLGKGVSSSAALEVACMQAFAQYFSLEIAAEDIAVLSQRVENTVVGAPCGLMDQMTSNCGKESHLMQMLCQPGSVEGHLALPKHLNLWGIDSGIRHSVGGSDYSTVRIGTYIAYRILAEHCGFQVTYQDAVAQIEDARWHNYLGNISVTEWGSLREHIPEQIKGADFVAQFTATHDLVTTVVPDDMYFPRVAADHPVYEEQRVQRFIDLLRTDLDEASCIELGALMYAAHESYNANNIGSDGTDHLVRLAKAYGPDRGVFGAKISGGGSGGTVAFLAASDAEESIQAIMQQYAEESGRTPELFAGSSLGAHAFGTRIHTI